MRLFDYFRRNKPTTEVPNTDTEVSRESDYEKFAKMSLADLYRWQRAVMDTASRFATAGAKNPHPNYDYAVQHSLSRDRIIEQEIEKRLKERAEAREKFSDLSMGELQQGLKVACDREKFNLKSMWLGPADCLRVSTEVRSDIKAYKEEIRKKKEAIYDKFLLNSKERSGDGVAWIVDLDTGNLW